MYKYYKIIGIRKVKWDMLWHVIYEINGRETWDRVDHKEALSLLQEV